MTSLDGDLVAHRALIAACLKHNVPFYWRGSGTLLIAGTGIRAVLQEVRTEGHKILGLEGFELESSVIHPRLDLIFDASRLPVTIDPILVAADWPGDVWVDVSLSSGATNDRDSL
jgi:hypothetical protein